MSTKEVQGRLWSVAPHYWSKFFEPFFLPLYKKTIEQLQLDENILLLDAGCGSGLFSHMAISTGAQVIGIDAAPGLLEIARERNPQNSFLEEDLETLPFAAESFHVVAGFNAFQYAGNFTSALAEAKRVLKKGGRLVIGIWDKPEFSDATNILKAIGTLLPPPPPGTPGPFALSEDGKIESICESLELRIIYKTKVSSPFIYYSVTDGIRSFLGTGPAAAALSRASERKVQQVIANALQPYHLTEDLFHLQNSFLLFIAER
ncbi:MAG TPA: class I SAM-dependent methyltransferase [Chitinophagaceae bacterium]|nr:class I SAM-dependent methyltransferase [Chitinophagaceae bacterium]